MFTRVFAPVFALLFRSVRPERRSQASTRLAARVAWPLIGVLVLFLALAGGILAFAADAQNRMARADSLHTARSAFHALERELSELVRHHAAWNAAGPAVQIDAAWARRHLGRHLFEAFRVDRADLYDGRDRPLFTATAATGERSDLSAASPQVAALLQRVRTAPAERPTALTGYLVRDDAVQLLAAAPLPAPGDGRRPVLVLARSLQGSTLARLGRDYLLAGLSLAPAVPDGWTGLELYSPEGRRVTRAVWRPAEPGAAMLERLSAPVAAVLVAALLLGAVIAERARDTAQRLDDASADLAQRNAQLVESERAARAARVEAELASRSKSDFLATMSHELRTPLNAVIGFGEILQRELLGPLGTPVYRDYARDIHDSGTHLLDLINDILDLSKAEAGKLTLHEDTVDLCDAVQGCVPMLKPRAREAGLAFEIDLPTDLPALRADPRKLRQILINLSSNAVKFTPAGGTVRIDAHELADGGVELAVQDTGVGIDPADMASVLEPFGQVDNALTRKHSGTGLGLSIVRAMAELHGGQLVLDSAPGAGTRAAVRLPAERVLGAPVAGRSAPADAAPATDAAPADAAPPADAAAALPAPTAAGGSGRAEAADAL